MCVHWFMELTSPRFSPPLSPTTIDLGELLAQLLEDVPMVGAAIVYTARACQSARTNTAQLTAGLHAPNEHAALATNRSMQ